MYNKLFFKQKELFPGTGVKLTAGQITLARAEAKSNPRSLLRELTWRILGEEELIDCRTEKSLATRHPNVRTAVIGN